MKRNGGLAAGLLAVLTFVGVSNLGNKSSQSPAPAERKKPAIPVGRRAAAHASPQPHPPCTEIAKRLRRLVTDTGTPVESWELPGSCYESDRPKGLATVRAWPGVRFAVAIVPNPVSTHLPLLFDRLVETIQQAAQDDNYSYDASWFPWDTTSKSYELLLDQQAAEDLQEIQQSQPGVIVFRAGGPAKPYDRGLVVLVVGEQPTGGISDDQFEHALDWIAELGGLSDGALRILGPTFSGSLPSLQRELERNPHGYSKFFVSSGTVSSAPNIQVFDGWMKSLANESNFRTAMESDTIMVDRFCKYLYDQSYDVHDVAFLSEDETAFGGATQVPIGPSRAQRAKYDPDSPCDQAIHLYYPRDIATLRSAYEQQSIFNPAKPEPSASTPSTTLRGDLSEPSTNDHDTVRSYGGQLTPLAQESILLDIANRLNEKHTQFIILRSTSSLDQIFLSQFLRRSYPEGRVVIDGADLLFNRGAEGKSLRGVMLLSTYPLLTSEQDWTASLLTTPTGSYRTFGEDVSEGVYIAARELFGDPQGKSGIPIRDYSPPAWAVAPGDIPVENQRPATWITVIARRQFWPLAALNANTLKDGNLAGKLQPFPVRGYGAPLSDGEASPLYLPMAARMFLLACLLWSLIHLYFCSHGSIMGPPRARAYFAPLPKWQHPALIAFGSALVAILGLAVAAGSGLFSWIERPPFQEPWTGLLLLASVLLTLGVTLIACKKNYALETVHASDSPIPDRSQWHRVAGRTAILGTAVFVLVQIYLVHNLTQGNRFPAYWRSVHLTSGVSGLLPEILLLAGAYLWFLFNLRGLAHFGDDRPRLPTLADLPKLVDGTPMMPMFSDEKAATPVEEAALPLTLQYLKWLGVLLAITVIVCSVALKGPWVRTLGELQFGQVVFWWVCFCIAVILADGIQTWRAWTELRQLLIFLDRLPLRRTLRALRGLAWGSIWKMSGNVLEERYRVISLRMESLRHLTNTMTAWVPDNPSEANDRSELLLKVRECQKKNGDFAKWFVTLIETDEPVTNLRELYDFQVQLTSIAGMVMKKVLIPAWRGETDSLIFGRANPDAKRGDDERTETDVPTKVLEPHVRAAEEFFVLPYLAFIQNILGRIRTIALGSLWLFVGTTLAISSYPFEPLSVLGGIFLVVFVMVGGLTVLVYSQMSRDATLSHITNTQPGQLGSDFWLRLVGFGVGPLIGLLTTLFPSITDFVFSWLQPSTQALK